MKYFDKTEQARRFGIMRRHLEKKGEFFPFSQPHNLLDDSNSQILT
jgi:hypothetical protein